MKEAGQMEERYDLIVVGAGPGGYVAAIKAAKLGLRTAIVEEREVGGTCLNRGCIPAKAMLHAAEVYREAKESERFGIFTADVSFDYEKILRYREETTEKLVRGVEQLLEANKVTKIRGKAILQPGRRVSVAFEGETKIYEADSVLLAAGSKPVLLPIPGMELPGVLTSDDLFALQEMPESLVIIGGGVISVEFATAYASFGCKVTILEAMPRIVPGMDKEISQNLKLILKKRGVDIHTSASVKKVEEEGTAYTCWFEEKETEQKASAQYVLCAVGRCPNTDGLFAEGAVPEMERGRIVVDEHFRTSLDGVYAIGDLVKGLQLAHAASAQGIVVSEEIAGKKPSIDLQVVPGCVYTDPEIASVGLTEEEAKAQGVPAKTGKFIMSANGKSLITQEERGFIKIIAEEETGVILGAQMMCARATDMIGELGTAVANRLTAGQLLRAMRAHPTYNEGVGEALEELEEGAIHTVPRKKR